MLKNIITSRTKRRILDLVFDSGDDGFYLRQICRDTNEPPSAVNRELKKLEQIGFIVPTKKGKTIIYTGNRTHPMYSPLRELFDHEKPPAEPVSASPSLASDYDVIMDED